MNRPEQGDPLPEPIFAVSPKDEVVDELAFHIEMRTRELVSRGIPVDAARATAHARFIDLARTTAECHHLAEQREHAVRRAAFLSHLVQDVRYALRMLWKRKAFAALAILPIALGIAAATSMYSVIDGVMLRPLPFLHPERLVAIWATEERWHTSKVQTIQWNSVVIGSADFTALRARSRTMSNIGAWGRSSSVLSSDGAYDRISTISATSNVLDILGLRPVLGRGFRAGEDVLNGPRIVMLGWEAWQNRFKGDSAIVGKSIVLDTTHFTIVGVLPPKLRLDRTQPPADLWLPAFREAYDEPTKHNRSYRGLGRLAPGATVAQANAEVAQILTDVKIGWKGSADGTSGRASNWQEDQTAEIRPSLLLLSGAVGLLLLIACVNVATLMFGESARRQPEIAARSALGATPGRLARQLLTESLVIALGGAVLGTGVAWAATRALVALAPPNIPGLADVRLDGRVLFFTIICAAITGIAFGLLPTFALLRWGKHSGIRVGAGQSARGEDRIQRALVATEVALSLIMLVGCSLLGRSLVQLTSVNPGFISDGLLEVQIAPHPGFWDNDSHVATFLQRSLDELKAVPGVVAVAGVTGAPFSGGGSSSPFKVVGRTYDSGAPTIQQRTILGDYFGTTRIPIIAGRTFNDADSKSSEPVVVLSQATARRDFNGESPVGKRVIWQGKEWTVIGVVGDIRFSRLSRDVEPTLYTSVAQWDNTWMTYVVRGTGDGTAIKRVLRERFNAIDKDVTAGAIDAVPTLIQHSYAEERYRTVLGSLFGMLGAVLAAIGMFGVISRTVSRRMREAGIRVALGSPARALTFLMLRETAVGALIGVAIGLPVAIWLASSLKPYLFGVNPSDPLAFATALVLLAVATLAATLPPARRAGRVDPVKVLRAD